MNKENKYQKKWASLPQFTPPKEVWQSIDKSLSIKEKFGKMSSFEPKTDIWSGIDQQLSIDKQYKRLPSFEPNDQVWQQIEKTLENKPRKDKPRIINFNPKSFLVAASFLLLCGIYGAIKWNLQSQRNISITTEIVFNKIEFNDSDEDFDIKELCKEVKYVCESSTFKLLELELKELDDARSEIRYILTEYEDDKVLISKLNDIEIQRSSIMRKMIAMI